MTDPIQITPDANGRYGEFGGRYVPEVLMPALNELESAWREAKADPGFVDELNDLLRNYVGRPTPLYLAKRLSAEVGVNVWIKREDLAHTGSHKINNVLGQCLLAKRIGKTRIIAETGAGQHGVATATGAALLGLPCTVYMGEVDVERQALNVFRMRLLGAEVEPVGSGSRTLKDAVNEALRDWVTHVESTHYILGSVVGPHPFPWIVSDLQRIIGDEARAQILDATGQLPKHVVACVGGGSNAIGIFKGFVGLGIDLVGVEAGGDGIDTDRHGAAITAGATGVLHGARTRLMQDEDGLIQEAHSISAGLDYPGVGPEHAYLASEGLARYEAVTDTEALDAFVKLSRLEGILPALEPSHAVAWLFRNAGELQGDVVLLMSGRGDKDVMQVRDMLEK